MENLHLHISLRLKMPNKRKTVQQREEELAQRIMEDVNTGMDARFARFEELFERLAPTPTAPARVQLPPIEPVVTRSKKRAAEQDPQPASAPRPAKVSKQTPKETFQRVSHSTSDDNSPSVEPQPTQTPGLVRRQSSLATPRHPANSFAERPAPEWVHDLPDSGPQPDVRSSSQANRGTGISNTWAAWTTAHNNPASLPTSTHDLSCDDSVNSQVKQILATTVHNLCKGNNHPFDFPFKYILRGPEKIKATINSVTLPEHLWGIFRMIHDPKTNPDTKPCLMLHVEQLVEDAREYEWETGVRRWSEEVFSRIAEGRLSSGWHSTDEIQRMRMILGQSKPLSARSLNYMAQRDYGRKPPAHTQSQPQNEIMKGGPPCPDFNAPGGCVLKSGHVKDGKRFVHICSFCLYNTSAANPHSEAHCRNKLRLTSGSHHF